MCLTNIKRQSCAAHTLQLSVKEDLKHCKNIHQRTKFFQLLNNKYCIFKIWIEIQWLKLLLIN